MIKIKELKERLKRRINYFPEDKLNDVSHILESMEIENNKGKILSFAGSRNDMDDETFDELTKNLKKEDKTTEQDFFNGTSLD